MPKLPNYPLKKSLVALLSALAVMGGPVQAAPVNWTGATGFWDVAGNWNPGIPAAPDNVTISVAGVEIITHSIGADTINTLTTNANANLVINGGSSLSISNGGTNTGTIQAGGVSSGTLNLNGGTLTNTGGTLNADGGGVINLNSVYVAGGSLNSAGTGRFVAGNNSNNFLDAATLNGTLDMASATGFENVVNGLTLNGSINVNNNSILYFHGDQTLGGTGAVVFGNTDSYSNRVDIEGNSTLTLGSGVLVHGENGTIGNWSPFDPRALVNQGTISADVGGGVISLAANSTTNDTGGILRADNGGTLQMNGAVTNKGLMEASNSGLLELSAYTINNAGGQITANAGGTVHLDEVNVQGGTLTNNGGTLRTGYGWAALDGSTSAGAVTIIGEYTVTEGSTTTILGTINNTGNIQVNGSGTLSFWDTTTLTGGGTVTLNANRNGGHLTGLSWNRDGDTLNNVNNTIQGFGVIGADDDAMSLNNGGLITANVDGAALEVDRMDAVSLSNTGTLQATNGGTLSFALDNSITNQTGGTIEALAGSQVVFQNGANVTNLSGNELTGGIWKASSEGGRSGTIDFQGTNTTITTNNADIYLIGANSVIQGTDAGDVTKSIDDTLSTNNSALRLQDGRVFNATANSGNFSNNGLLELSNGSTFQSNTLNTNGTVASFGDNELTTNSAVTGYGVINSSFGTLTIAKGVDMPDGTLTINPAAAIDLSGATTTNAIGTLNQNGSLNLGGQNIVVGDGYNNANFGNGNAFDKHAGVSGTGQIFAAGTAPGSAQILFGDIVGGGPTSGDAVITFGNVHVGDVITKNYQIDSFNWGGPELIGAIQTAVNGGNITDTRLSGSGVKADNFGVGFDGGPELGVTLNATSAGALAGQQVHILNNFDNTNVQNLYLTGAAYNLASASGAGVIPNPVILANQRVGENASQVLTITNTAPTGSFTEKLNGSVASFAGDANSNGGSFNLLAAGNNSTAISAGVNTGSAGHKSGDVTLGFVSDGSGTSGLGQTTLANQVVNVSGDVYRMAQGNTTPTPVTFGNSHVGDTVSQALIVRNTAATDGFSESLNAGFGSATGSATTNSGTVSLLAAGGSDSSAMSVGLNTSSAGAKTGSVNINYVSDGSGTSGLAAIAAGSQAVDVSGNVYRLASANTLGAISFGNVHVNDTVQQALNITNTAVNDGFSEKLNASFGGTTDTRITTNGGINQLDAGASDHASMIVGLNTSAAGTVNGTQTILFASDGTGTSGLGITGLPSQGVNVSGDITTSGSVYRLASASPAAPNPVDFGNVRIGTATDQVLSITNTAANDGFSEKLNASISSNGAPVTAKGVFNLLGPQDTNNTSLHVGIDTTTAGAKSGAATIALASDGTGTSGLGITTLSSHTVNVSGAVYRLANSVLNTSLVSLGAARVGDSGSTAAISITNSSPDSFTEGLKASTGVAPAGFAVSGAIGNLAAGGTDAGSIQVALNTGVAGSYAGTLDTHFTSTGAGTTGAADILVGTGSTDLTGNVYQTAAASVTNATIDFGIKHIGDVVATQALTVNNIAPVVALNDTLNGSFGGATGPFTASGTVTNLAAGGTDNSSLVAGLNTSAAGVFNGSATASFASHNTEMADLALPGVAVQLTGQVNNYANPDFALVSGPVATILTGNGLSFDLNFGTVFDDTGIIDLFLSMANNVTGPADLIDGSYDLSSANEFIFNGFTPFANLGAGAQQNNLKVGFNTNLLGVGSFADIVYMDVTAHNASGYKNDYRVAFNVSGQINARNGNVSEPESLLLMTIGLSGLLVARRRRTMA